MNVRQRRRNNVSRHRRAVVIAQVAMSLTVLIGFMALAVDVGAMYSTKAELQRSADAAALAAAAELGDQSTTGGGPQARARTSAQKYSNLNTVLGTGTGLSTSDLTFGSASIATGGTKYTFTPSTTNPNAVQVKVQRAKGSPSGAMPLFFARIFGKKTTDLSATATAVLTPRDICFVLDLSLSHSFDSQFLRFRLTDVGPPMKAVWKYLNPTSTTSTLATTGPTFGNMNTWGTDTMNSSWNYNGDAGLTTLKRGTTWTQTAAWTSQSLASYRTTQNSTFQTQHPAAYSTAEMSVINSSTGAGTETSTTNSTQLASYRRRTLVALGIYRWESGKAGGQVGKSSNGTGTVIGNGDNVIDAGEVVQVVPFPNATSNPYTNSKQVGVDGSWDEFINYMADTSKADNITSNTGLTYRYAQYNPTNPGGGIYGDPGLRSHFGIKSFLDYIQQVHYDHTDSPGLSGAPEQPMGAVADGVKTALTYIKSMGSNDQVALVGYGQVGYGPTDDSTVFSYLNSDFDGMIAKVNKLQAAYITGNTCISLGIDKAAGSSTIAGVLQDSAPNARKNATKIIFLLTDGVPNVRRSGANDSSPYTNAVNDTYAAATDAATANKNGRVNPCFIYTVAVSSDANVAVMQQVATIGHGTEYTASGDYATYSAALQSIFVNLGGKRPVLLIQ